MKVKLLKQIRKRFDIVIKYSHDAAGNHEVTYYVHDKKLEGYIICYFQNKVIEHVIDVLYPEGSYSVGYSILKKQALKRDWIRKQSVIKRMNELYHQNKN